MRKSLRYVALLFCMVCCDTLWAQLPPGNAAGVATGHIHMDVVGVDKHRAMWRDFGAQEVAEGRFVFLRFPGIYLMLNERAPTGPSAGSSIDHLSFTVQDYAAYKVKLAAHGARLVQDDAQRGILLADLDGGVRVEFRRDPRQAESIRYDHVQLAATDPRKLQAWYVQMFGAQTRRGGERSAAVPGGRVDIVKVKTPPPGSQGRAIDHIGFEVNDVEAFAARIRAQGMKLNLEPTLVAPINVKILFFTDPGGTYIELTQGLRGK